MNTISMDNNNFNSFVSTISMLSSIPCSDVLIRNGIVRQSNNSKSFVVYVDMRNILKIDGSENYPDIDFSNLVQKANLLEPFRKQGSDVVLEISKENYVFKDHTSKIKFDIPYSEYLYVKFITDEELYKTLRLSDEPPIVEYTFQKFLLDRISACYKTLQCKYLEVQFCDGVAKFLMKSSDVDNSTNITIAEIETYFSGAMNIVIPIEIFLVGYSDVTLFCKKTMISDVVVNEVSGNICGMDYRFYHRIKVINE